MSYTVPPLVQFLKWFFVAFILAMLWDANSGNNNDKLKGA